MLRFEDLRVRDRQDLDRDFFNRRYRLIAETYAKLDARVSATAEATDRLVELGLVRVNEVLGPLLAKVQAASENGFLVAHSATEVTLSIGLETTLAIADPEERALFSPTPYVLISRAAEDSLDDWAVARVQAYDRANGGLAVEIVGTHGNIDVGVYNDWIISATAGLAQGILEAAVEVTQALTTAQSAAATAAAAAAAAQAILASGPVSSVNGQTGAVLLGLSDIPSLVATLGGKADANHGHTVAQVSGLQAALDGKLNTDNITLDGGTL